MKRYETMLITSATLDEEATAALVGKFKALIEANGEIEAVEEWGKRRLAYPINKENEGIYTLIHFSCGPDFPAELERVYGITDGVVRSLVVAKPEGAPPVAQEEPAKEAAAAPAAEKEPAKEAAPAPAVEEAPAKEAAPAPAVEEAPAKETAPVVEEEPAKEEAAAAEEPPAEAKAKQEASE